MDRRSFLSAALLAALKPFERSVTPTPPARVSGFVFDFSSEGREDYVFVVPQAVLVMEESPAFLLQDVVIEATASKGTDGSRPLRSCEVMATRMVGPYDHAMRFCNRLGRGPVLAESLKLGVVRQDASPMWVALPDCFMASIGVSFAADSDKGPSERMWVAEYVQLQVAGEPALADGSRRREVKAVTPEEIRKATAGYRLST